VQSEKSTIQSLFCVNIATTYHVINPFITLTWIFYHHLNSPYN